MSHNANVTFYSWAPCGASSTCHTQCKLLHIMVVLPVEQAVLTAYLSTSLRTILLTLLVLCFGSLNGPCRNLQFLPNWHLPSRSQFLHFSGGYDSLGLERYKQQHWCHLHNFFIWGSILLYFYYYYLYYLNCSNTERRTPL